MLTAGRVAYLQALDEAAYRFGRAFAGKQAADAVKVRALSGKLYLSKSGWLLLSVPNAIVRGLFDALDEPGAELPLNGEGKLEAHVSVVRPEELAMVPGGAAAITERGHAFRYSLEDIRTVEPAGWPEMSRVWFCRVSSPELQKLRKTYGLPPLPVRNGQELPFHLTIARRRKAVLYHNDVSKAAKEGNHGQVHRPDDQDSGSRGGPRNSYHVAGPPAASLEQATSGGPADLRDGAGAVKAARGDGLVKTAGVFLPPAELLSAIDTAREVTHTSPTEAQQEAGNLQAAVKLAADLGYRLLHGGQHTSLIYIITPCG